MGTPATKRDGQQKKIGQVAESTGLSRELIHHYLRQGLLPPSPSRALYSEQQVRLLHLIKRLREHYGLSLELIRHVFERFEFDPDRIEPLTFVESLNHRLTRFAEDGELSPGRTLAAGELAAEAGVSAERLGDYLEQGLVRPLEGDRFSVFEANVIALCERGVALGIPFESFRTIASHIRVAFQFEHAEIFNVGWDAEADLRRAMEKLFLRREVVGGVVLSLLQALIQRHVYRTLEQQRPPDATLDDVVYRPSGVFVQRHGLGDRIERLQEKLARRATQTPERWMEVAELQLHAGHYREAAFFLERALSRWPKRGELAVLHGIALVLSGQREQGRDRLERLEREHEALASLCAIYRALALFLDSTAPGDAVVVRRLTERALEDPARLVPRLFGGWLLTALPPAFADPGRGRELLWEALRELERGFDGIPGQRERFEINTAYLLHESIAADSNGNGTETLEDLRTRICRLDPACAFARRVYLEQGRE
jgi:DNA-binding transcriptional MerR regulator